jgi:hypothetical protein
VPKKKFDSDWDFLFKEENSDVSINTYHKKVTKQALVLGPWPPRNGVPLTIPDEKLE